MGSEEKEDQKLVAVTHTHKTLHTYAQICTQMTVMSTILHKIHSRVCV
jgi:hypothetical protein